LEKTKVCTKCGEEKPATTEFFYKAKLGKYGLQATCKKCKRELFRDSRKAYREKHKEYYKKLRKAYYEKNKEKEMQYNKKWEQEHKEYVIERRRKRGYDNKYNQNNKDRIKEFKCNYKKSERGKLMSVKSSQKRRARECKLESSFTIKQWGKCKAYFNNTCCYCGEEKDLTQDHFLSLLRGGEYTRNNIVPCCSNCNSSKRDKDFFDWYPLQEFYSKKRERRILKYLNYNKKEKIQQLALTN